MRCFNTLLCAVLVVLFYNPKPVAAQAANTGPWFIPARVTETAPQSAVEDAARQAVSACSDRKVVCTGMASGDQESVPQNVDYARIRENQCVDAVQLASGTSVASGFRPLGVGDEHGRGVYMSCASGGQGQKGDRGENGSRGDKGDPGKNCWDYTGDKNGDGVADEKDCVFVAVGEKHWGLRATGGLLNIAGIRDNNSGAGERNNFYFWDASVVYQYPKLVGNFGVEGSGSYGHLYRDGEKMHKWTAEAGVSWRFTDNWAFLAGFEFYQGVKWDSSETSLLAIAVPLRLSWWPGQSVELFVQYLPGYSWHIGRTVHDEVRTDGWTWRVTETHRFKSDVQGFGLGITVLVF